MSGTNPEPVRAGSNEFQFIPPDRVHFIFRGVFDDSDADAYLDFVFQHGDQSNRLLYAAYDLSAFTRATEAGRKRVINVGRPYPYAALAVIGASFSTRTVAGMILTAGRLIAPQKFNFPIKFLTTMTDAGAWFDEVRKERG